MIRMTMMFILFAELTLGGTTPAAADRERAHIYRPDQGVEIYKHRGRDRHDRRPGWSSAPPHREYHHWQQRHWQPHYHGHKWKQDRRTRHSLPPWYRHDDRGRWSHFRPPRHHRHCRPVIRYDWDQFGRWLPFTRTLCYGRDGTAYLR